jgi:tetratricopeptide (TPR) repeat protein
MTSAYLLRGKKKRNNYSTNRLSTTGTNMFFNTPLRILFYASITLLLVSCAGQQQESDSLAYAPAEVIVTGSRLAKQSERQKRDELQSSQRHTEQKQNNKLSSEDTLSWRPSAQSKNNAVIKIGNEESINPEAMDVSIQIDGYRARVVIDGFYTNPHSQNLEGDFKFRLPSEAVPYFFAFGQISETLRDNTDPSEIIKPKKLLASINLQSLSPEQLMMSRQETWLAPKQAVMVSREKAAFAYNDTVAQQVDPALLEWGGAGIFSAKVFPLQAKKTHRVVIGYDMNLKRVGGDLMLDLPLTGKAIEKRVNLLINKKGASAVTLNQIIDGKLTKAKIIKKNNELIETKLSNPLLDGVRVTIKEHADVTLVESDRVASYFTKQWLVDLPQEETKSNPNAIFVLDTSLSASPQKFHQWLKLVNQILVNNKADIQQFGLVHFNTHTQWWKQGLVKNNPTQRKKLKHYLEHLVLEGATNLSAALQEVAAPKWAKALDSTVEQETVLPYDVFLLSDGSVTWGETEPYFISESVKAHQRNNSGLQRLFTYSLGATGEDQALLNHLTREIGGSTFQLSKDEDYQSLSRAHRWLPWTIKSLESKGANDIIISGRPTTVYPGQLLTIAGRSDQQLDNSIDLVLTKGSEQREFKINTNIKIDSSLAARSYGQIAVSQLESLGALEQQVASAYANFYRVPGRSSSLLMLESPQDYQRYKINPQQDAYIVKRKRINSIFSTLSENIASSLSSPKTRFMAMIEKLNKLEMIKFKLPDASLLLFDELPLESFTVSETSIQKSRSIDDFSASRSYLKMLKSGELNYQQLQEEAKKRIKKYAEVDGLTVLSSLVEDNPSDVMLIREVAFAAEKWGLYLQAFQLHQRAILLRPFEPQSYNYLAKLAHKMDRFDLAVAYFEIGVAADWPQRFGDFKLIHQIDYANFLRESLRETENAPDFIAKDFAQLKHQQLAQLMDSKGSDVIVSIGWNTDRSDIDLHVIEPSGEECFYSHKTTQSGGYITTDVTQGYGPEMYMNRNAPKGEYEIYVKYFSSDRNKLGVNTNVQVRIIENWGRENQKETIKTVSLKSQSEKQLVAEFRRKG